MWIGFVIFFLNKDAWAGAENTPIAAYLSERVLAVPLFADMDLNVVDHVCDIILE